MNPRILVGLAAVVLAYWGYARWRQGLRAAMVLLVLEGAIRKWVFPEAQDVVYFVKDILFVGVYLGFLSARVNLPWRPRIDPGLASLLGAGAAFGMMQIFNPNLPSPLVGILGFKAYFLYVPLLWVVPAAFTDDRELARFLKRYAMLAVPVGLLAVVQFASPATSMINTYARTGGSEAYVATFGSSTQARVTATFSYITGYSSYVFTIAVILLAILAATRWRIKGNLIIYATLGLTILGMLMSGSRGPVFMLALLLPLYWWLGVLRETGSLGGRILLGAGLLAALLNYVGADAVEAFYGRAEATAGDVGSRLLAPFLQPFYYLDDAGLIGLGIGASHQTAVAVTQHLVPYSWLRGLITEGETGQVMIELGVIGFLLVYAARIYLVVAALRQVFLLRTPFHRAIATSCVLFFLAHLPGGVVFNVTSGVYHWFFAGLLFLVQRLDAEALRAVTPVAIPVTSPLRRRPLPLPAPTRAALSGGPSFPEAP